MTLWPTGFGLPPVAFAQLGRGDLTGASDTYQAFGQQGQQGASYMFFVAQVFIEADRRDRTGKALATLGPPGNWHFRVHFTGGFTRRGRPAEPK